MRILKYFPDNYDSVICFDVETTGLDFRDDEIIEFACVEIGRGGRARTLDRLVNVHFPLPYNITRLTNITDAMLQSAGIERWQLAKLIDERLFNKRRILMLAHNANFDAHFLKYLFEKEGMRVPWERIDLLDTLTVLRDRKQYPHRLESAITFYGLDGAVKNSHRALDDAMATLMVFERMSLENGDVTKYINLFGYDPRYGITDSARLPRVRYEAQWYDGHTRLYEQIGKTLTEKEKRYV